MCGTGAVKMKKTAIITLLVLTIALSLVANVWGDMNGGYETVGGTISQTNFITAFLVPAVIAISIFGAILLLAFVRLKRQTA
jgi:hypothetical protein